MNSKEKHPDYYPCEGRLFLKAVAFCTSMWIRIELPIPDHYFKTDDEIESIRAALLYSQNKPLSDQQQSLVGSPLYGQTIGFFQKYGHLYIEELTAFLEVANDTYEYKIFEVDDYKINIHGYSRLIRKIEENWTGNYEFTLRAVGRAIDDLEEFGMPIEKTDEGENKIPYIEAESLKWLHAVIPRNVLWCYYETKNIPKSFNLIEKTNLFIFNRSHFILHKIEDEFSVGRKLLIKDSIGFVLEDEDADTMTALIHILRWIEDGVELYPERNPETGI